ncbi:MAG: hypothetical protein Kow0089_09300 [Desulfobulbaceae bacterium]
MKRDRNSEGETATHLFAIGTLVLCGFVLSVFFEKITAPRRSASIIPTHPEPAFQAPAAPKTTVAIQPLLVTEFPPLPDFTAYDSVEERKAAFIDYLVPIIEYQNFRILRERSRLETFSKKLVSGEGLSESDRSRLRTLALRYDVAWDEEALPEVIGELARRVDIIPVSLAVVQAAKESSWGRSRYAVEINNLFGQWCFEPGCGVVPGARDEGAVHEVQQFDSVYEAARSYIHNLNTHPRYETLRKIRQYLRIHDLPITGEALAEGLQYYSERRQAYVEEVKDMIRQFHRFQERRTG